MVMRDNPYAAVILADIHDNETALRAVLSALDSQTHDTIVFAGDLVLNGPRPAETLAMIRALHVPTIYGNADRYVCDPHTTDPGVQWVQERLDPDDIAYLADLPFAHRITPPGGESPTDDLLIVHATPTDVEAVLTLESDRFGLLKVTPHAEVEQLIGAAQANLILAGHLHYASSGTVGDRRLATLGSVGLPYDGDVRARLCAGRLGRSQLGGAALPRCLRPLAGCGRGRAFQFPVCS